MAGAMNKANQRQSGKRRRSGKYPFKKIRMHTIPFVCKKCGQSAIHATERAYRPGGNRCPRCGTRMSMNSTVFEVKLVKKEARG